MLHDVTRENLLNLVSMGGFVTLIAETAIGAHTAGLVLRETHDGTGLAHVDFSASWNEDDNNPALQHRLANPPSCNTRKHLYINALRFFYGD